MSNLVWLTEIMFKRTLNREIKLNSCQS